MKYLVLQGVQRPIFFGLVNKLTYIDFLVFKIPPRRRY